MAKTKNKIRNIKNHKNKPNPKEISKIEKPLPHLNYFEIRINSV